MSGSRSVITPLWLSGSLRSFSYSSSVYSGHFLLISSASVSCPHANSPKGLLTALSLQTPVGATMFCRACVQPGFSRAPTAHDDPMGARGHSLVLKTLGVMTLSPFRFLLTKVHETQGQASFLQACAQAHFTPALHPYQEAGKAAVTSIQPSLHKLTACFSHQMT